MWERAFVSLSVVVASVAVAVPAWAAANFAPAVNYAVGTTPAGVAVADFNGDGKADLASPNVNSATVSVLLGNGDGTFGAANSYAAGDTTERIAVGDFNGDGKIDLGVDNIVLDAINVLLGNGDGSFAAPVAYPAGDSPRTVIVADFNGDGKADLATASSANSKIAVLLGNGDGTFQAPLLAAANGVPNAVAAGDFDGDGKIDLASSDGAGGVDVLLGNGDGTFAAPVYYGAGNLPRGAVAAADVNEDNVPDLLVGASGTEIAVLLGKGDGTFGDAVTFPAEGAPRAILVADLDGDDNVDLVTNDSDGFVKVLPGRGDGTFGTPAEYPVGDSPNSVALGDFNGDGHQDLVSSNGSSNNLSVLIHTPKPVVSVSPASLKFAPRGALTTSPARIVTIKNTGDADLLIASASIQGPNTSSFKIATNGCSFHALTPGSTCTIGVTNRPSSLGPKTGSLAVASNTTGSPIKVPLSGTGLVDTIITKGPPKVTGDDSPTISYKANVKKVTFECRRDTAAWKKCTSPTTPKRFTKNAKHTFSVRAVLANGTKDTTPAKITFYVHD